VRLEEAIVAVKAEGRLRPKAVIAVDLFGQPADYPAIAAVTRRHGLKLIADSAQGLGGTLHGRHPIHWADAATTSFFPAKPLGAYGDGGAVFVDDDALWDVMDSLRVHGKATGSDLSRMSFGHDPKYLNMRVGMNSRLDTLQAAILLVKLTAFPDEIEAREVAAKRYADGLEGFVSTPSVIPGGRSVWAQYTVEHDQPEALGAALKARGVPTARYYPIPMHLQAPYSGFDRPGGLVVSEAAAKRVISLPMHSDLTQEVQEDIIAAIIEFAEDVGAASAPVRNRARKSVA
jgi:dTDP-4-amino-4,6-dideoxygalactose transaminase